MFEIGKYNDLIIEKEVSFGVYLRSDRGEILMPSKYVPSGVKPGDSVRVYIYKDSEDRLIATTLNPMAVVGEFAALRVKDVNDTGAFLEWGLEKDLLVPHREQHKKMMIGQQYVVRVCLDQKTERIIAVGKLAPFFSSDTSELAKDMEVDLLIYEITDLGYMAIINNKYRGILYKNEVFINLGIGSKVKGYIKKIREDNKIDLCLQKQSFEEIKDTKNIIMDLLIKNNGFMPYSDNSSSEEIKEIFQMSKKTFKKSIGGLFKERKITISDKGISLQS